jgi:hypothetical protein
VLVLMLMQVVVVVVVVVTVVVLPVVVVVVVVTATPTKSTSVHKFQEHLQLQIIPPCTGGESMHSREYIHATVLSHKSSSLSESVTHA